MATHTEYVALHQSSPNSVGGVHIFQPGHKIGTANNLTRHFSAPIPDDSLPNILPNSQFSACVIVCPHQNIEDPKRNGFSSGCIQTRGLIVDNRGCCHLSHRVQRNWHANCAFLCTTGMSKATPKCGDSRCQRRHAISCLPSTLSLTKTHRARTIIINRHHHPPSTIDQTAVIGHERHNAAEIQIIMRFNECGQTARNECEL